MKGNNTIPIGGELESIATGGVVVSADGVKDYQLNKLQEDINLDSALNLNRAYDTTSFSGLGKRTLKKHVVSNKNVLTREMMSDPHTVYVIQYDYDLDGEEIVVPTNCILEFDGGSLRNGSLMFYDDGTINKGVFKDCAVHFDKSITITGCTFDNPNLFDAIRKVRNANKTYAQQVGVMTIKDNVIKNVGISTNGVNSTYGIYCDLGDSVDIINNKMSNIGNINLASGKMVAMVAVGYLHNSSYPIDIINTHVNISNNVMSSLVSPNRTAHSGTSGATNTGESHFIITQCCNGVVIANNKIVNNNDLHGWDSEFIYSKSDNVVIENNVLLGQCGGEAAICCKPYLTYDGEEEHSSLCHATIQNNTLDGNFCNFVQLYGNSDVRNNTMTNIGYYAGIGAKTYDDDDYCVNVENNVIVNVVTISGSRTDTGDTKNMLEIDDLVDDKTSTSRVNLIGNTITVAGSYTGKPIVFRGIKKMKLLFKDNRINRKDTGTINAIQLTSHSISGITMYHDLDIEFVNNTLYIEPRESSEPQFTFNSVISVSDTGDSWSNTNIVVDGFTVLSNKTANMFLSDSHISGGDITIKNVEGAIQYLFTWCHFNNATISGTINKNTSRKLDSLVRQNPTTENLKPNINIIDADIWASRLLYTSGSLPTYVYNIVCRNSNIYNAVNADNVDVIPSANSAVIEKTSFNTKKTISLTATTLKTKDVLVDSRTISPYYYDVNSPIVGDSKFDTTNGKPIWYNGTNWVYADGTTVS